MYKIEQDVAMPRRKGGPGRSPKYPFGTMEIGDSFEFHESEKKAIKKSSDSYGRSNSKKFAIRDCRIWRIE